MAKIIQERIPRKELSSRKGGGARPLSLQSLETKRLWLVNKCGAGFRMEKPSVAMRERQRKEISFGNKIFL